jgi:hypothetical protein
VNQNAKQHQEIKFNKEATVGKRAKTLRLAHAKKRFIKSKSYSYNVWNVPFQQNHPPHYLLLALPNK